MATELFKGENEYAAQADTGALLNPRIDSTFKALFTQKTKESEGALKSFLSAATERRVMGCTVTANDAPIEFAGQRGVSYDIACEFEDGTAADVEMQAFNQKYDYGRRAEYQVARLEATYFKKGSPWEHVPTVYQISILDFEYQLGGENASPTPVVSRYAMRTKDGRELSNALNIIFVELPKAVELEESLDTNTALENWAIFLKDADDPEKKDIIDRLTSKEEGLMQAQKSLSAISRNHDLWIAQYRQEIYETDRISGLHAARQEGIKAGEEKGRNEGRNEGRAETQRLSARTMLADGVPAAQIAKWTGLSIEEIQKL